MTALASLSNNHRKAAGSYALPDAAENGDRS